MGRKQRREEKTLESGKSRERKNKKEKKRRKTGLSFSSVEL